mgnify:CR=1 FL=1
MNRNNDALALAIALGALGVCFYAVYCLLVQYR